MSPFSFPRMLLVRQNFPDRQILDLGGEVRRQLAASSFASKLKPGDTFRCREQRRDLTA